jgi:hypothetical protein
MARRREGLSIQVPPAPPTASRHHVPSRAWITNQTRGNRDEIRDFLASRRAQINPQEAGLPTYGGNRRVPGLRREEVALLAGVSVDY